MLSHVFQRIQIKKRILPGTKMRPQVPHGLQYCVYLSL